MAKRKRTKGQTMIYNDLLFSALNVLLCDFTVKSIY